MSPMSGRDDHAIPFTVWRLDRQRAGASRTRGVSLLSHMIALLTLRRPPARLSRGPRRNRPAALALTGGPPPRAVRSPCGVSRTNIPDHDGAGLGLHLLLFPGSPLGGAFALSPGRRTRRGGNVDCRFAGRRIRGLQGL
jgi:hypothetical protein